MRGIKPGLGARTALAALPIVMPILMAGAAEAATPAKQSREDFAKSVCAATERHALRTGLDASFFVRLLWKESMFDPNAVSPKGAQGLAQFMPATAERVWRIANGID